MLKWLKRVVDLISAFTNREEELLGVLTRLKNANPELKAKIYYLLRDLQKAKSEKFGMIIVLSWQDAWYERYASVLDSDQNIFEKSPLDLMAASHEEALTALKGTADFDGAILIDQAGRIVASGIFLENMNAKELARSLHPDRHQDLSEAFGFARKVHTRHLTSIAASYRLPNSTVYVVSEEDGSVRIFENGKIIWSTLKKEMLKYSNI